MPSECQIPASVDLSYVNPPFTVGCWRFTRSAGASGRIRSSFLERCFQKPAGFTWWVIAKIARQTPCCGRFLGPQIGFSTSSRSEWTQLQQADGTACWPLLLDELSMAPVAKTSPVRYIARNFSSIPEFIDRDELHRRHRLWLRKTAFIRPFTPRHAGSALRIPRGRVVPLLRCSLGRNIRSLPVSGANALFLENRKDPRATRFLHVAHRPRRASRLLAVPSKEGSCGWRALRLDESEFCRRWRRSLSRVIAIIR